MNTERLTRLEGLLRSTLPEGTRFDMGLWVHHAGHNCDTICCAAGLAMLDPWFQAQGLGGADNPWQRPMFCGLVEYPALASFFDLSYDDTKLLFDPAHYPRHYHEEDGDLLRTQPEDVADRIAALLRHGSAPIGT